MAERVLTAWLVAVHLLAASLPCAPAPPAAAGAAHADAAHRGGPAVAGPASGAHHHGPHGAGAAPPEPRRDGPPCHGEAAAELDAPCPCGCDGAGTAGPGLARLDRVLPGTAARPAPAAPAAERAAFRTHVPRAPVRAVDHVPRPA